MHRDSNKKEKKPERARDQGRKYPSGAEKAKKKKGAAKLISELPKLSTFFSSREEQHIINSSSVDFSIGPETGTSSSIDLSIETKINNSCSVKSSIELEIIDSSSAEPSIERQISNSVSGSVDVSLTSVSEELNSEKVPETPYNDVVTNPVNVADEDETLVENGSDDHGDDFAATETDKEHEMIDCELYSNDIGLWPEHIDEGMRCYWLKNGSADCRNYDGPFDKSAITSKDRVRHCRKSLFTRRHTLTGEVIDLTWLCYSEATGKVFCFICRLLSVSRSQLTKGFNDWKNSRACIESHSRSPQRIQTLTDCTIRKKHEQQD